LQLFNFRAKPDPSVPVSFIPHVNHSSDAARFFRVGARHLSWHSQRGLDRHADLQSGRRRKKEASLGNVQCFGKVLGPVGGDANGTKAQRRAQTVANSLAAF